MNIRSFAELCNCSFMTVANVFSSPEKVKKETRERILSLAKKHNFRPNRAASASFNGKTKTIGVMTYPGPSYFHDIVLAIQQELMAHDYLPVILYVDWEKRLEQLQRLIDQRVDGFIMIDPKRELSPEELREFQTGERPCVYIEPAIPSTDDWISTDDYRGGVLAAEYLLRRGHRRIAVSYSKPNSMDRSRGFIDTLNKKGIDPIRITTDQEIETLTELLARPDYPTAIFLYTDCSAPPVYETVRKAGFSIPGDISVIGFADLDFSRFLSPPLTTVRQDGSEIGKHAAEIILKRLKNKQMKQFGEKIPVQLIERESVADFSAR